MKTMQTAGRGSAARLRLEWDVALARAVMREEYGEARFEVKAIRSGRQYRSDAVHREFAARMKIQHDLARAALRNLNALKAEVAYCDGCAFCNARNIPCSKCPACTKKADCAVCGDCAPVAAYGGWCCVNALKAEVTP